MKSDPSHPARPAANFVSVYEHHVAFYETDAMGIMHHANYVKLLERARVLWLSEHDVPYREWVEQQRHFAVTRVDVRYRRAVGFDDALDVAVWVIWVRGASCGIGYEISSGGDVIATAVTEHGMVDDEGRPTRIPADRRESMAKKATGPARR